MLLASCTPPLLKNTTDKVPQALLPAVYLPAKDGRARFREIYCAIREDHGRDLPEDRPCEEALADLGDEPPSSKNSVFLGQSRSSFRTVVVPGIFGECVIEEAPPFEHARDHIESLGFTTGIIDVKGRFGSQHNAKVIADYVRDSKKPNRQKILLIAYSKGLPDVLTALSRFPDIRPYISGVVSVAGVVSGTPLADGFQNTLLGTAAERLPLAACEPGDKEAIKDLSRGRRMAWLAQHRDLLLIDLPKADIHLYSLVNYPKPSQISAVLKPFHAVLSQVDPRNDSQTIFSDAVIPGSTILGYVRADHWAVILPFSRNTPTVAKTLVTRNEFPREVLLEAIVRYVEEDLSKKN